MTMAFGGALADGSLTDMAMLERLEQIGLDGVELPSGYLLAEAKRRKAYATYLSDSRMRLTCIDGICNLISEDPAARAKGVDDLRAAIELAWAFGCPLVLAAGSHLSGGITPDDGRRMIVDGLCASLAEAQQANVTLAIEDFGVAPTLQCAACDCIEILDAVPGLRFVFDTGNFYFAGEDPVANLDLLAERTVHVHFKDWIKSDTPEIADVSGAPLGGGIIPNQELAQRLAALPHIENFSLEVGAPGDKFDAAKNDLDILRKWIESQMNGTACFRI